MASTSIRIARHAAAALLAMLALSGAAAARSAQDFAGHWVFKLGERNFIILELTAAGEAGALQGAMTRPRRFQATDGHAFSGIEMPGVRFPLVRSAVDGELLRVTFANPLDPGDESDYELRLAGTDRGTLKVADIPFEPFPLERVSGPVAIATDWCVGRTYRPDDSDVPNAEMARLFAADQADRKDPGRIDWSVVGKADAERRAATRVLLDGGLLRAGEDFERAAFVFQHGSAPDDFLLAHTLALVAVAKGREEALWIAAATLDRYLQTIGKPQVYGTQYLGKPGEKSTQEPFNRALVPDALRRRLGVPSLAEQEEQRRRYEASPTPQLPAGRP